MRDVKPDRRHGDDALDKLRNATRRQAVKRFYQTVSTRPEEAGYSVRLDERPVRTPARRILVLPTLETATMVADEFARQEKVVDPATMPLTRLANTVIDAVADDPQPVLEDVLRFASSDLLCYRAGHPEALVALQNEMWDPILEWARNTLGANMALGEGVMHVEQPREAILAINVQLRNYTDPFAIAGLHVVTTLTGSALLALAVAEGQIDVEKAWAAAHVDEDWNISRWGEDREAAERRSRRREEMMAAAALLKAVQDNR